MKEIAVPEQPSMKIHPRMPKLIEWMSQVSQLSAMKPSTWRFDYNIGVEGVHVTITEESSGSEPSTLAVSADFRYPSGLVENLCDQACRNGRHAYAEQKYTSFITAAGEMDFLCRERTETDEDDGGHVTEWGCGITAVRKMRFDSFTEDEARQDRMATELQKSLLKLTELKRIFDVNSSRLGFPSAVKGD